MENSGIGWTDHTWNPWQGCNKVSDACKYCYIGGIMKRAGREPFRGPMRTAEATWKNPYRWNRAAEQAGRRVRVFTCSMSDFFHAGADDWREEAWSVIRDCQSIDWLVLTKRADRIVDHLPADWGDGFPNVWLGVTVESRSHLRRVELLSRIPAAVRFVSAEPLLQAIDFHPYLGVLDWIITGCEKASKVKRRHMDLDWVRSVRDQCAAARVPHFFKQYYVGNQVQTDGVLDGRVCQEWPSSRSGH